MKNLTKIFMAVVAGMFAFSCVTDTTEDLGVKLEGAHKGQGTTLTLSMPEVTKTHLGAKVDNLYPLYWSDGDAILLNGNASNPLEGVAENATAATFSFNTEDIAYPYCVVYPAPETKTDGEATDGEEVVEPTAPASVYPVNFLATQKYTVDTFAPQAAPMYTYVVEAAEGEEQEKIVMKHLTGVLRLAVKGNGETLTALTVSASAGKIAGPHTIDCATGELVALEEAGSTVTVVLPEEGLVLGAEATPIYVTVPAGKHGVYTVTLVSDALEENTMVVKFNSDFHPVTAGVVKEFGEFTFAPNANNAAAGELVIVNAAQLKRLAQLSETEQLGNVTKVTIGATIDLSDVAWTPINLLPTHIVFDGGADQGFSIKGLKAPLFNSTAATIQNLSLTDVAIVETADVKVGAIARSFHGTMKSCVAAGTLEMNNTEFNLSTTNKFDIINIGGLVGQAGNATFENCENRVNVTIKSVTVPTLTTYIAVGGAIGGIHTLSSLTNVDNYGAITIDVRHEKAVYIHAAGVVGQMISYSTDAATAPDVKVATQCDNHGTITTTAESTGHAASTYAGIVATMTRGITNFSDNHNHGAITCNDHVAGRTIGGIVGAHSWSAITNCTNNAALTNNGNAGATRIGGIIGGDILLSITNCTNNGVVKNSGNLTGTNNFYIGGISGSDLLITDENYAAYNFKQEDCHVTNCHNKAEIINDGTGNSIFVAGIVARTTSATINECTNTAAIKHIGISKANCYISGICGRSCTSVDQTTNSGAVIVGGEEKAPASGYLYITGIVGSASGSITNTSNSGAITVIGDAANTTAMTTYVAGISNTFKDKMAECSNSGDITVKNIVTTPLWIAGISNKAYCTTKSSSTDKWQNVENSGDITLENLTGWTGNSNCYIGGLVGHLLNGETIEAKNRVELYNWTNKGDITTTNFGPALASGATGKEGRTILGGCFGHYTISQFDLNDCNNEGDLNIEIAASSHTFIGGIAGFINQSATIAETTCSMQNCDNSGAVTVNTVQRKSGTITPAGEGLIVSGLFGEWYMQQTTLQPITLTNCNNSGAVTLKGTLMASKTSRHVVGGVSADHYSNGSFINCHNSGTVSVEGTAATTGGMVDANNLQVGGVTAYYHPYRQNADQIGEWIGCTNTGNISIKNIKSVSYVMIGGVLGYNQNRGAGSTKLQDCGNSGELLMENVSATANSFEMAGIVAYNHDSEAAFTGEVVNTGNIIAKNVTTMASKTYIGGILGYTVKPIANAKSYCDIHAIGLQGKVGMIMGIPYAAATKATNCGIAGNLIFSQEDGDSGTDDDGNPTGGGKVDVKTPITGDNYLSYIYTAAVTEANGCSFLSSKPALPVYTPAE